MKALSKKNKLIRDNFKKAELKNYINSALLKNNLLTPSIKGHSVCATNGLPSHTLVKCNGTQSKGVSKIRNICVLTGRARAVIQKYKMSRIQFKQNAEAGLIPGVKKL